MRTIRAIAIFAVFVLVLTSTAGMVSAGVEPSPFKTKTILNRLEAAQNQLGVIDTILDHVKGKATELNNRGSRISVTNLCEALPQIGIGSLRTLKSSQALYEQSGRPDIADYSETLEKLREYNEALKEDIILGLEPNPLLPKEAKMALRQLAGILFDIEGVIDSFLTGNVD